MLLETKLAIATKQKQILSQQQLHSLHILSLSEEKLNEELQSMVEENPLLEWDEDLYINPHEDVFEKASTFYQEEKSLYEVLEDQLRLCPQHLPRDLVNYLIDALDTNGYLRLHEDLTSLFPYDLDTIEETISILQTFEPVGIFARDLQESLLIQLSDKTPYPKLSIKIVHDEFEALAAKKWNYICDHMHIEESELKKSLQEIQSCNARPTSNYQKNADCIMPEAKIEIVDGRLSLDFLRKIPNFRLNQTYVSYTDNALNPYIEKQKKIAQQIIGEVARRYDTIQLILLHICEKQKEFFLHKHELIPLTQKEIAQSLSLSESTVSRALMHKIIEFENRYIPVASLFPTCLEQGQSSSSIMNCIQTIIKKENQKKPYSDQNIANLLDQRGIQISRRTVTKYREQLHIPTAQQRKSL